MLIPTTKEIGVMIRAKRNLRGVNQVKLAEKLGVSFQQVQKYENGQNKLSLEKYLQIADFLEFDPFEFLRENAHSENIKVINRIKIAYVNRFLSFSTRTQLLLLNLVEDLKGEKSN